MSLEYIYFKGKKILKMDLEGINDNFNDIAHVIDFTKMVCESNEKVLVLVNVRNYMPGKGFLEYSTITLDERAGKIEKAAYVGINKKNRKMFEYYDKFNIKVVNRRSFEDESTALLWLTGLEIE
jgi:hypothetical protein